jgi:hypothetical protein
MVAYLMPVCIRYNKWKLLCNLDGWRLIPIKCGYILRCPEKFSQPGFKEGFEDMRPKGKEILRG